MKLQIRLLALFSPLLLFTSAAQAAPTVKVTAQQESRRPDNLTIIPVWEAVWWVALEAYPKTSPLARVDYRARFDTVPTLPTSGGWDVGQSDRSGLSGRIRVRCERLADYDRPVHVEVRVTDTDGESSPWQLVEFPVRGGNTESTTETADPAPESGKKIGTVHYVANDDSSMGDIRKELTRLARAQGGSGIGALSSETLADGRLKFSADVIQAAPPANPAVDVPSARDPDRVLSEIKMRSTH